MEKRALVAIALSFLVLGFYPLILEKLYPGYQTKRPAQTAKIEGAAPQSQPATTATTTVVSNQASALGKVTPGRDQSFQSQKLDLTFNDKSGGIRRIALHAFTDSDTKKPIELFSLDDVSSSPTFIHVRDLSGRPAMPPTYNLTLSSDGVQAKTTQDALVVTKNYRLTGPYQADLTLRFDNDSAEAKTFQYAVVVGPSIPPRHSIDTQYIEANFFSKPDGKSKVQHVKETKLGKVAKSQGSVEWVATKDRHFSVIVKPKDNPNFTGEVEGLGDHRFRASLLSPVVTVPARGSVTQDFLLYIGPNDITNLVGLGLDPMVNFGKLDAIGKILVGGLELLHKVFRNYGLAVIALTILINILLFPLTRVSYMSMKRMQLIQPHMTKLREQHKKNPEKLNKEMMELYRKHKVNPFGGCLPMILQMPVFIALYVALSKSVILVNAKLFWIKDLSSPDDLPLPFSLPFLGDKLHVLPLVMVVAMFLQQKFTQVQVEGQEPAMQAQQRMMSVMMPIMFGFIFYSMPSGLVLYWLTNTILMASYQLYLKRVTLT